MATPGDIQFLLRGQPADLEHSWRAFETMNASPYDPLLRMRFRATDNDGNEWVSWCQPSFEVGTSGWTSEGSLDTIAISVLKKEAVSAGTEMVFPTSAATEFGRYIQAFVGPSGYTLDAFGTTIRFSFDPTAKDLTISFPRSDSFATIYIETWIGQVIRILFGQAIGPRLTARYGEDGTTRIGLVRANRYLPNAQFASLFLWTDPTRSRDYFWSLFSDVLMFVSRTHTDSDLHPLTQFYDEISEASLGSRWVWALTLSSGIEGLTLLIQPDRERPLDEGIMSLIAHLEAWTGPKELRNNVIAQLKERKRISTSKVLHGLQKCGAVQELGVNAWRSLRNRVAHGSLISPWSNEEEDGMIEALATLFHDLTRHLVGARS